LFFLIFIDPQFLQNAVQLVLASRVNHSHTP
jgi:hypothetical protein